MALLTQDGRYIKLDINGNYYIYSSKAYRNQEKYSTSSQYIINKYEELLRENNVSTQHWKALQGEYQYYLDDLALLKGSRHSYEIMAQYCKDVYESIPMVSEHGQIYVENCQTLHDVYEYVKSHGYFGPVKDV